MKFDKIKYCLLIVSGIFFVNACNAVVLSRIDVTGNQRMDAESGRILSDVKVGDNVNSETINNIAQDSQVNITKKDDLIFDVVINGELMDSFDKLGEIQNKIVESCNNEYHLKTVYGDGQDATLILKKISEENA